MEQKTGRLINSFDFCQLITDVYCAQLTKRSAQILQHSIYQPSFHGLMWLHNFSIHWHILSDCKSVCLSIIQVSHSSEYFGQLYCLIKSRQPLWNINEIHFHFFKQVQCCRPGWPLQLCHCWKSTYSILRIPQR